ncbi:unnamed protein product [Meloidogyne enterolobii]|uniref:Uncharacterized protein n=1 Tax=Meloidogyne enterolobii TaxID=390850 RepID=A0ACB0YVI5_MELEN
MGSTPCFLEKILFIKNLKDLLINVHTTQPEESELVNISEDEKERETESLTKSDGNFEDFSKLEEAFEVQVKIAEPSANINSPPCSNNLATLAIQNRQENARSPGSDNSEFFKNSGSGCDSKNSPILVNSEKLSHDNCMQIKDCQELTNFNKEATNFNSSSGSSQPASSFYLQNVNIFLINNISQN